MKAYFSVRKWVDHWHGQISVRSKIVIAPATLPFLPLIIAGTRNVVAWVAASIVAGIWLGFVAWRGWRVTKAATMKADRIYDRKTKFDLSTECQTSESWTASKQRKKHG